MEPSVYLPLALPVLVVPVLRSLGPRLHPAVTTWLVTIAATVIAVASTVALAVLAAAGVATLAVVAWIGGWSTSVLWQSGMVNVPLDAAACIALGGCAVAVLCVGARRIAALFRAYRAADSAGDVELVVTGGRPMAHALPGRRGRIVVSRRMLELLDGNERQALFAHERAHLAHRHHLFLVTVELMAAANPLLSPLRPVIRYAVERWADESAAESVGSRHVVARAIGKAALGGHVRPERATMAMAATAGPVPRRVAMLLGPAPTRGGMPRFLHSLPGLCVVGIVALAIVSVCCALQAGYDLHGVLEFAQAVAGTSPLE